MHARTARGASAVEYGLMIAGIAAVIAVAVYGFGGVVREKLFDTSCATISSAISTSSRC